MESDPLGLGSDDLPQLGAIDQLNKLWKNQESGSKGPHTRGGAEVPQNQSQPLTRNMGDENQGATEAAGLPDLQLHQYEATPDLEFRFIIFYVSGEVKHLEGSLNPTKTIAELRAKLSQQLNLQPDRVTMSWSQKLTEGQGAEVILEGNRTLFAYKPETDDTIILREYSQKVPQQD